MPKDIRKEIERVIKTIDLTLEQSEKWAKEKGAFFSGSIFGPEVRKALVEVLEITKVTNENGDVLDPIYDVQGHLTGILMNCEYLRGVLNSCGLPTESVDGIENLVRLLLKDTEQPEPPPSLKVFVAYKTERHSDKFITFLGSFTTYEAAKKACDDDGKESFPSHHPNPGPNSRHFHYDVEETELKS